MAYVVYLLYCKFEGQVQTELAELEQNTSKLSR